MENEKNKVLKEHLQSTFISETSKDFTLNVMSKIDTIKVSVYKPLISKKVWLSIIAFLILAITLPFIFYTEELILPEYYNWIKIPSLTSVLPVLSILVIGLSSFFIFILIDYIFRKKQNLSY